MYYDIKAFINSKKNRFLLISDKRKYTLILLIFSITYNFSQSEIKTIPLNEVITHLESLHNIRFSYKTSRINNETLEVLNLDNSLDTILNQITNKTSMFVEKISDRYYLILDKNEPGKLTLCGYLKNEFSNTPIPGATLFNIDSNHKAKTDTKGYFELYLSNPTDRININALGFKRKQLSAKTLNQRSCPEINLIEEKYQLEEVIISDYLKNDLDKLWKSDNISLNPNKIGTIAGLAEPDIFETLQILPGVQAASESASELLIRGGNPDQNLILLDGIKIYNNSHLFGAFSIINPFTTENIELYRGDGVNPKYGGALGGVIDITSVSYVPNKIKGSFGSTLIAGDVNLSAPLGNKIGIITSLRSSINTLFKNDTFDSYVSRATQNLILTEAREREGQEFDRETSSTPKFIDLSAKIIFTPHDNDNMSVTSFYNKNKLNSTYNQRSFDMVFDSKTTFTFKRNAVGLGYQWNHRYSNSLSHHLNTYISNYFEDLSDIRVLLDDNDSMFSESSFYHLRDASTAFSINWDASDSIRVHSGYDFSYLYFKNKFPLGGLDERFTYGVGDRYNRTHSLFTNITSNFNKRLSIDMGVRANMYSVLNNNIYIEPRAIVRFKINKHLKSRLSYSKSNQIIHQLSFLSTRLFTLETNPWVLIEPEYYNEPMQNEQYSAGLFLDYKSWNINLDIYSKTTRNINTGIRGFQQFTTFFLGIDETQGMDILIKKRFGAYRSIFTFSYMNQYYKFKDLNRDNSFPGNFDTTFSVNWSHSLLYKNFEFALNWHYRSGIPYSIGDEGSYIDNEFFYSSIDLLNTERLSPYHRLNASSSYVFKFSKKIVGMQN